MEQAAISVTRLNQYLKGLLESDLNLRNIWISGEISNLTMHGSGHIYLRLKDADGVISAVMFRSSAAKLRFRPENGMKVLARGSVSIFEKTGVYQLYITELKQDGAGDLHIALEQLKKQLAAAGIFDIAHKLKIPASPARVGVITSPTGAAVRDIIQITGRRWPLAEVIVYPALVQGDGAPESLIRGVEYFEKSRQADVLIIGRGGGSIEDLWAFNSPELALTIYNCTIPTISAVGHETDYTICDWVADLRAPTPSGAAELAVPDQRELLGQITEQQKRMQTALTRRLQNSRALLERYAGARILKDPKAFTDKPFMQLDHLTDRLCASVTGLYKEQAGKLSACMAKLDALSPLKVLSRGFTMVSDDAGKILRSAAQIKPDDRITLRWADGDAQCRVEKGTIYGKKETEI